MDAILIEYFEPMIETYDLDGAGMIFLALEYDDNPKDSIWVPSVRKAVDEGYLYPNEDNTVFRLTNVGKDFMRMVMI